MRPFFLNLALVCGSLLVFGAALEVGARLLPVADPSKAANPLVRVEGTNRRVTVDGIVYESNNLGFRMPYDLDSTTDHDGKRVLVLGDSYAYGAGLPYDDLVSVKMEADLRRDLPGVNVINAAVSGTNTWDQYQQLMRVGSIVKPDLVTVFFYTNDLDHPTNKDGKLRLRNALFRSRFFATAYHGYKRVAAPRLGVPKMWIPGHYVAFDDANAGRLSFQAAIRGIKEGSAVHGAGFLLVIIPSLVNLDDSYPFVQLRQTLHSFAQSEGVRMLDLFDVFAELEATDLWLNPTDPHWNALATGLAAEAVSAVIREERLLSAEGESPG